MTQAVAQIALGPNDGKAYGVVGHKYRILVTGEQTGGEYAVFEAVVPPGEGAPPHLHVNDDEFFYVADGAITLIVEGREIESGAGSFALVPKGTVHTFHNQGPGVARLLVTIKPAGLDKFFQEVGVLITDPGADPPPATLQHIQRVIDTAPKYGMQIQMGAEA
ncbi:MAG: cupin domain-containing protein [Planctomycetota bacterium]|jgi:quercetin dioxygenase-like cupin family protein